MNQLKLFIDLTRLKKPIGFMLLFWPCIWGLTLVYDFSSSLNNYFFFGLLFLTGSILMRSAGCIVNDIVDRNFDKKVERTKNRPIPKGMVKSSEALSLGIVLSIISTMLLILSSNIYAGFLLACSILFYIIVYTIWLKRKTYQNIVIGGAAGALPPLIGWVSVSDSFNFFPIILFLIIFIWTPPHFWALSLYVNQDYKKANIPMLPVIHGKKQTIRSIIKYSFGLYLISLLPYFFKFSGLVYFFSAVILGALFIYFSLNLNEKSDKKAKNLFKYSIVYLFLLYLILVVDSFFLIGSL